MIGASITSRDFAIGAGVLLILWLLLAAAVAEHGRSKGYAWFPLFICGVFLGWPLVLLGVTLASGGHLTPAKRSHIQRD